MILLKISRKVPLKLYHYTDLSSFIGIASNKEFWLSNLYFQNDKHEYELGLNIFHDLLIQKKKEHNSDKKITTLLNSLDSAIDFLKNSNIYTLSLSEEPDLLSQWRGYADNCRGVRIELTAFTGVIEKGLQILPCIYEKDEQKEYVAYLLNKAIEMFNKIKESGKTNKANLLDEEKPYSDAIQEAGSYFISTANVACAIIKNASFAEEKEWRLIVFNSSEIFFRQRSYYIVPFIKKNIANLNYYMTDIMTCSSPEKDTSYRSIRFMLDKKGFGATKISNSIIPYRL